MSLFDDSVRYWKSLKLSYVSEIPKGVKAYTDKLGELYANGEVIIHRYQLVENSDLSEFNNDQLFNYLAIQKLFSRSEIIEQFDNYSLLEGINLSEVFTAISPFDLPGRMGQILQIGGAYSPTDSSMNNFYLGLEASLAMCDGDLNNSRVYIANSCWSSFFRDVAWDYSILVLNMPTRTLTIIMATDED